jgi:cob(I)alamin adenosyltransferase
MARVNLTRIYTRTGDGGTTRLGDRSIVSKTHPRIVAYGTVDELNSHLGVVCALDALPDDHRSWLTRIQNVLFDIGADLSVPGEGAEGHLSVSPVQTAWLEERCDELNAELSPLRSFVLPGGTLVASQLHVCRTVCRRAERCVLGVDQVNPEVLRYLNRLSDFLFILARTANARGADEVLWQPEAQE